MRRSSNGARPGARPPSDGESVIEFIEACCRHVKGDQAGQTIVLDPWQRDLITDLFELRSDGRRRYREALIGIARKNGKSTLCAALGLYFLVMDGEPGAEVYSCAGDKEQARIVFGTAKTMVEMEPELADILTVYKDAIEYRPTNSVWRVVSADAPLKEGLNPSAVIFDELHVQPNRELYDVMAEGMGARRQPMMLMITTAGYDLDTICGEKYLYGKKVQSGEVDDPTFFYRWWEPRRPEYDYRDPAVWAEANPGLGQSIQLEALESSVRKLPPSVFIRYHLDAWTATAQAWLPPGAWEACLDADARLDPSLPLFVGIDVALRNDSTAVVCAQRQGERYVVQARVWENPWPESDARHQAWELNLFEVEAHLRELRERFPQPACEIDDAVMPGPAFYHDPAYFQRSAQVLAGDGLAMVAFPQTDHRMVPASQGLYSLVVERKLAHAGDPTLSRHIGNAVADIKPRGWRLTKPKGSRARKIDAAIACAIACYAAQTEPPKPPRSVYEDRGVIVI